MDLQQNVSSFNLKLIDHSSQNSLCRIALNLFFLIDDFLSLGCYSAPSTFSFNAMTQANAIAKTDSMSWSLCARNCQFQSKPKKKKKNRFLK